MKTKKIKIFCLIIIFCISNFHIFSKPKNQENYIKYLFENKRYFQAIAETDRYYSNKTINNGEYEYFIALNYFMGNQYKSVLAEIHFNNNVYLTKNKMLYLNSLYNLHMNQEILDKSSPLEMGYASQKDIKDLGYLRTSIYLESFEYDLAINSCQKFMLYDKSDFFKKYESLLKENDKIKYKSTAASILFSSVVPGAGQIYSQRYFDGLLSFFVVAAGSVGTYYLYKEGNKTGTYICGALTFLCYSGNIFGAYNSSKRYNYNSNINFKNHVLDEMNYSYKPEENVNYDKLFK